LWAGIRCYYAWGYTGHNKDLPLHVIDLGHYSSNHSADGCRQWRARENGKRQPERIFVGMKAESVGERVSGARGCGRVCPCSRPVHIIE